MKHTSQWILTPCGTSILTNKTPQEIKDLIFKYANEPTSEQIPAEDLQKLQRVLTERSELVCNMNEAEVSELSAELNALTKYLRQSPKTTTHHVILPTDTWLGKETAQIVHDWLKAHTNGASFEILSVTGLQTKRIDDFQIALSDLSKQLIETIDVYRAQHSYIAFNLTGGFKAVISFLQTISTCLADESFYIFERSEDLLRIPRLPVQLNPEKVFNDHVQVIRRIALGLPVTPEQCVDIPETLILQMEGEVMLSALGQLQWDAAKREIYRNFALTPPSPKIWITPEWADTFESLDASRRYEVNKRMDELACYLEAPNRGTAPNPNTLNFKSFTNNKTQKGTFQIYAWSDRDARRIYGHFLDNGIFQIDTLEKHS
jgi:putative CRISPR-associated protein (TIGR02619 family)